MSETFDPYHKWLGISPKDQPPNHYRLLGIDLFEADREVVAVAAKRQAKHLRTFNTVNLGPLVQRLLNEVHAAFLCLSDPAKKQAYDASLREKLGSGRPKELHATALPTKIGTDLLKARPLTEPADNGFDLESLASSPVTHRPHPQHRKKVPWQAWASVGAAVIVLVVVGTFVLTGGSKEKTVAPTAGEQLASKSKPEVTVATEKPKEDSNQQPEPKAKTKQEAELAQPVNQGAEPEKPNPEAEKPTAETPEKAEERLKQALTDSKTPEDFRAVAKDSLKVFEQAVAGGQTDLTKKIATIALVAARKAKDSKLADEVAFCYVTGHRWAGSDGEGEGEEAEGPAASGLADTTDAGKVSTSHDETAAEKPGNWIVIFRSSDPSIWNSDVNKGKDDFAISLSKVPVGIKYLRMRAAGKGEGVIVPIANNRLTAKGSNGDYGWNGTNTPELNGHHLGIYSTHHQTNVGDTNIWGGEGGFGGLKGFGFGNRASIHDSQGYSWNEVSLPKTVFEIAVKSTALTRREQTELLQGDEVSLTTQTEPHGQSQGKGPVRPSRSSNTEATPGPEESTPARKSKFLTGEKNTLVIVKALYGSPGKEADVTAILQKLVTKEPFPLMQGDHRTFGDPAPFQSKRLAVSGKCGQEPFSFECSPHTVGVVPPSLLSWLPSPGDKFTILAARFGAGATWFNVTEEVRTTVTDPSRPLTCTDFGMQDPYWGTVKHVVIWFDYHRTRYVKVIQQGDAQTLLPQAALAVKSGNSLKMQHLADLMPIHFDILDGRDPRDRLDVRLGGRTLTISGEKILRGLVAHPPSDGRPSRIVFDLNGSYGHLAGAIGVFDSFKPQSPLTFRIEGDGRPLWKSQPLQKPGVADEFKLRVATVRKLELIVDCPGSIMDCWAVWIDPVLTR